jgi:iron complex transport system permease protein
MNNRPNHSAAYSGTVSTQYRRQFRRKLLLPFLFAGLTILLALFAVSKGAYNLPLEQIFAVLTGHAEPASAVVITHIRLPRVIAALVCGWGLSLSGLTLQSLLKNPLASPSTLGISQGAAFGAAAAIVMFSTERWAVTVAAFAGAATAAALILTVSLLRRLSSEAVILAGAALSSLFLSGTILIQYLASETQLAQMVFWTFGDTARSSWTEIGWTAGAVSVATLCLSMLCWDFNALSSGEETAKGLGVPVERTRTIGVLAAASIAALATAFHGVIAFVGLLAPHMARRLTGDDHRLLIPLSSVLGALLLLAADTLGRTLIDSGTLPVGVLTSFLGAPMFLYLLIREKR